MNGRLRRLGAWVPLPTGRAVALLVAVAVVVLVWPSPTSGVLVGLNVVVLVLVVVDAAAARFPATVERDMPGALRLRTPAALTWEISNPTLRSMRLDWADDLAPSLGGERRAGAHIPPHGFATVTTSIEPQRRGHFVLSTLTVRSRGPLGLGARQTDLVVAGDLRVLPAFPSRRATELRLQTTRPNEIGLHSATMRGTGTEFDSLRDYTVDDESRRIDWAATARSGRPIVRAFRVEQHQNIGVLVDTGRRMGVLVDGVPRLEHAMDGAMALAVAATSIGDHFGLLAADTVVRAELAPTRRADHLARVTVALHDLEPVLVETDHLSAMELLLRRFQRRSLIVVLTDLAEHGLVGSLEPALRTALSRHVVVVGAVKDPAIAELAERTPVDSADVYDKVAAIELLRERDEVTRRLVSAGADVLDCEPGELGLALVEAYLGAKARGRL